ncbi:MAG: site-specific DNA-methyltransferase, partial [Candidatus Competibacteraceae bacterium]|nr:site-specific DNA-methyltransferase [Candidatus Competibacteraceae bacterium]
MKYRKVIPPNTINLDDSLIMEGDALHALRLLPSSSIQCVVTSPPYWGLRDYGIDGQIGLEATLPQFINHLVAIFNGRNQSSAPLVQATSRSRVDGGWLGM